MSKVLPLIINTTMNSNTNSEFLQVKKLSPDAILPVRKTADSAGYDLHSIESVVLQPFSHKLISTGIAFTVPYGTYGQLAPRSGLSCKGINVGAGVIDRDYTGHVKVLLFNTTNKDYFVKKEDRIAQLIIKKISTPEVLEVIELSETTRGENGFGSTGV